MFEDFFEFDCWSTEEIIEEQRATYYSIMAEQAEKIWRETILKYNTIPEAVGV